MTGHLHSLGHVADYLKGTISPPGELIKRLQTPICEFAKGAEEAS